MLNPGNCKKGNISAFSRNLIGRMSKSSTDEEVFSKSSVLFSLLFQSILIIGYYNVPSHKMNYFLQKKWTGSFFNEEQLNNELLFAYTVVSVQASGQQYIVIIWQLCSRYNRLDNIDCMLLLKQTPSLQATQINIIHWC